MGYVYHPEGWYKAQFGADVFRKLSRHPSAARRFSRCIHFGLHKRAKKIVDRLPEC